jgi:hypothetical protein
MAAPIDKLRDLFESFPTDDEKKGAKESKEHN